MNTMKSTTYVPNDLDIALWASAYDVHCNMPGERAWGTTLMRIHKLKPALARAFVQRMIDSANTIGHPNSVRALRALGARLRKVPGCVTYTVVGWRKP